jgi:uncharacterized protein with PIN domain
MLGSLNRWLRICGYQTEFYKNVSDQELITKAKEKDLILLTRDRALFRKATKKNVRAFIVDGNTDEEKIASVANEFGLKLDTKMARCTICGSELNRVLKESVKHDVPLGSLDTYNEYWRCRGCAKIYWRGSHWKRIEEKISKASDLLKKRQY